MTIEMGLVFGIVGLMLIGLIMEVGRPELLVLMTLFVFIVFGFISPEEGLAGFSNQGMLTIGLLFIVGGVLEKSGLAEKLVSRLLSGAGTERKARGRLLLPLAGMSGFLNNTPLVVTLTPVVRKWCEAHNLAPSKFLIPLSYAAILGGTMTLMGTSTNLVIHGLLLDFDEGGFRFFDLAIAGLPVTIVGLVYLLLFAPVLLPDQRKEEDEEETQPRDFLSELRIQPHFPYSGKTVREAGLGDLKGLTLIEIKRGNKKISPVTGETIVLNGDRLFFTGVINSIADLGKRRGLLVDTGTDLSIADLKKGTNKLREGIVSHQSSLLGRTVKENRFRQTYDAAVVAVHRNEERVEGRIGDIQPKAGDVLLMVAGESFDNRAKRHRDFYVTSPEGKEKFYEDDRTGWSTLLIFICALICVMSGFLSIFEAMAMAVALLLTFRLVSPEEALKMIQFKVLVLIAGALGIGNVIIESKAAAWMAQELSVAMEPYNVIMILAVLYGTTALLTEIVTNNAAAVIMFPVAYQISEGIGMDPIGMAILIAIAASASFLSPIGYQTNLIVLGPGGYRLRDYLKVGLPLTILTSVVTIGIICNYYM
ncbi:SLC13 family permease [Salimicrobium halophilum]|uniref:Di-and tricarboxylate transporter n=1 Tax=Salimicrobium halophilum TaxID=86666 RepID=A0A1G8TWP7_9BACI|nr:SLC13 family permease [Salimicrobium halophilum]SDJ45996.1 Di-and tricarboxylate transporter [Salimicrobium halophilum]